MAKRKHLPALKAGDRYEGWMPFTSEEPVFLPTFPFSSGTARAEVYATRKDAIEMWGEDVRHVTIIVTKGRKP